jgi:hypothetical protein
MLAIVAAVCAFMRHGDTGKFLPDDFNVTEIEERTKWEDTRPFIGCGVCRMVAAHALARLDVATVGEEAMFSFLESVCETSDADLFHRYQIADDGHGSWEARVADEPDGRREDIRKWQALSMRDTCTFAIPPNDEAIVAGLRRCGAHADPAGCVCTATALCKPAKPSRGRRRAGSTVSSVKDEV